MPVYVCKHCSNIELHQKKVALEESLTKGMQCSIDTGFTNDFFGKIVKIKDFEYGHKLFLVEMLYGEGSREWVQGPKVYPK